MTALLSQACRNGLPGADFNQRFVAGHLKGGLAAQSRAISSITRAGPEPRGQGI